MNTRSAATGRGGVRIRDCIRRWYVRWLVLPVAVLLLLHAGWTLYLGWRFDGRVASLVENGMPIHVGDLAPSAIPDEENAAALLAQADRWYIEHLEADAGVMFAFDDAMSMTGPEKDVARYRAEALEALRAWLERGKPYRAMLVEVAKRPILQQPIDSQPVPSFATRLSTWSTGFVPRRTLPRPARKTSS